MSTNPKRATIYFDPDLHRALRLKSAESERSMSDIVNEALSAMLREDAEDLADVRERENEPVISFEEFVTQLRERGKL